MCIRDRVEYHPIGSLAIDFDIPGSGKQYIDTNNIQLYVHAKIAQPGIGNNLVEDNTVTPVNLLLHSLFSQVDVSLNGTLISNSTNNYPYKRCSKHYCHTVAMPRRRN